MLFSGCMEEQNQATTGTNLQTQPADESSILPDWQDGDYHDYYVTTNMLFELEEYYPDLVTVFSIGRSVLGKEIWCITITNEENTSDKYACLIDVNAFSK